MYNAAVLEVGTNCSEEDSVTSTRLCFQVRGFRITTLKYTSFEQVIFLMEERNLEQCNVVSIMHSILKSTDILKC